MDKTFEALKQKKFVDREDFFNIAGKEISLYSKTSKPYFEVLSIYGMGGIGKSRFLKELHKSLISNNKENSFLSFLTLEIDYKNPLHALIRIRKQTKKSCYLFDYAILSLTEKEYIEKIDSSFLEVLRRNIFTDLFTIIQDGIGNFVPTGISLNDTIELINEVIVKGKKLYTKEKYRDIVGTLNELIDYSPKQLFEALPTLLGIDLEQQLKDKKLFFLIDAYDVYETNWLDSFVSAIGRGFYIITSREKIPWVKIKNAVTVHQMLEIPEIEAKKYLCTYIPSEQEKLIEQILFVTERIPIYMDLAISTYIKLNGSYSNYSISDLSFNDKYDIINKFLNHLTLEEQNTILVLSIINVFDENIFDHLVVDLNLPISKTQYNDFCGISIIDSFDENSKLKMFHNVFHINVSKVTTNQIKRKVFKSYLSFIAKRGIFVYSNEDLHVLFNNLVHLIQINDFDLSKNEIEEFLDVFFVLYENNCVSDVTNQYSSSKNEILFIFMQAVQAFRKDIRQSVTLFEKIKGHENTFGKHNKSFYAIYYYVQSISGKYKKADENILAVYTMLNDSSILDWYYGKIKIYYSDLLMLKGKFITSITEFEEYENEIVPYSNLKTDDIFEISKQIGHCYRFNFHLSKAADIYNSLWSDYSCHIQFKCYLLTSLCETNCYFDPDYVILNYRDALKLTKSIGQMRSYAKILYSLGIAELTKGRTEKAIQHIEESISLNKTIGYKSGVFFGMVAKSFYYYKKTFKEMGIAT